jgi:uroporphyrinogen decarboxylase
MSFQPDYQNLVDAAYNREAKRLPLYEHNISGVVIQALRGWDVDSLMEGDLADKTEAFRLKARFAAEYGYDCVAFEGCTTRVVQEGKGLLGQAAPIIGSLEDIEAWPWEEKIREFTDLHSPYFDALRAALPDGMKAVGGIGNGLFELIQDFVPLQDLAFLQADEPDVYAALWERVGDLQVALWTWFLDRYADDFAVCRFGDDLGFKSATLLQPDEIRAHILPQYKRIVDLVHARGKPFLLHSCGRIYDVMDDLIDVVGIDAKHSNEDVIDSFDVWVEKYGDRIGNFGGVEMDIMTRNTPDEVKAYIRELLPKIEGHGGIAIGTGNQIASYTEPANFVAMTEAVREWRGDDLS